MAFALFATARCYGAPVDVSSIPFLSSPAAATVPASVSSMGTPAAVQLPDLDFAKWFAAAASADGPADPYDVTTWQQVDAFYAIARTPDGWKEACKKAGTAAGAQRSTGPELGALGCSNDPAVTLVQQFAVQLLGMRAEVALWIRGVPGHTRGGIAGRQGEARLMCGVDVIAREGGADSPYAAACAKALETAYASGDAKATFDAVGEAYRLVADEIARRDPTVDPEAAYYGTAAPKK